MKRKILVLGGSGFLGTAICEQLVDRMRGGAGRIVVPTRRVARARHIQMLPTVELVEGSVHDDAFLRRVLHDVDAVINLVAILHGSPQAFELAHVTLPRRLATLAAQAGVRRLLHVSALGADLNGPSHYQRSKAQGEQVLQQLAAEHGMALTLFRPSVIFGAGDSFLNLFASLQRLPLPFLPLAGAHCQFQPVWVEDVARAVVQSIDDVATHEQIIECAGPRRYTLAELVRLAAHCSGGRARRILPLPMALGRLQAWGMEWLPGEPLMSRDNVDSMRVDNVATGQHPGLSALGIEPAGLETIAPGYLGGADHRSRLNDLRAIARRR